MNRTNTRPGKPDKRGFTLLELVATLFVLMVGISSLGAVLHHCRQLAARNGAEATALVVIGNVVERLDAEPSRKEDVVAEILRQETARYGAGATGALTSACRATNGCVVAEVKDRSGRTLATVTLKP